MYANSKGYEEDDDYFAVDNLIDAGELSMETIW